MQILAFAEEQDVRPYYRRGAYAIRQIDTKDRGDQSKSYLYTCAMCSESVVTF